MSKSKSITDYVASCTAIATFTTPVFAGLETKLMGLNIDHSIKARIYGAAGVFLGVGILYDKGRNFYRKYTGINERNSEKEKQFCDTKYSFLFNLVAGPFFYYFTGCEDPKKIAIGTVISVALGVTTGGITGYIMDGYKELSGVKKPERLPNIISNLNAREKVLLATLITVGSFGVTNYIYS